MIKTEVNEDTGIASQARWQIPAQLLDYRVSVGIGIYRAMQFYTAFESRRERAGQRAFKVVPFQSAGDQALIRPGQVKMCQEVHRQSPYRVLYWAKKLSR